MRKDWNFFIGNEIENTTYKNLKTLFVVGIQDYKQIVDYYSRYECEHIYFGANMSYCIEHEKKFIQMLNYFSCYKRTIDLNPQELNSIISKNLSLKNLVINLSIKLPNINTYKDNLMIKIDDKEFNYSNIDGVWVTPVKDIMTSENNTSWSDYKNDFVI